MTIPEANTNVQNVDDASTDILALPAKQILPTVFPSGLKSSYYSRCANWSNRRWAWEFLRRNLAFQEFCHQVTSQQSQAHDAKEICLTKFGLLNFKDYRERYTPNRPKFSSAQVNFWSDTGTGIFSDRKMKRISLASGEIIFRVSLRDAIENKKRKALIDYIATSLSQKAKKWAEHNDVVPSVSIQRGELLPLLRILDLIAYNDTLPKKNRITRTQMYAIVYPKIAWAPPTLPLTSGLYDKPFNKKWTQARKHTLPERYLSLAASIAA